MPPPGGEQDVRPPQIIATTPEPLAGITDLGAPVTFRFHERISEQGIRESVLVSPATSAVQVGKGGREIQVRLEGGWQANQVYRVVLLAGIRDLFGNERREPASLVFSTGATVPHTAVAGLAYDRLTGRPANDVIVEATRRPDSVTYSTAGDTSAFFALTHLPLGEYDVVAYLDQNRNRRRDPAESRSPPYPVSLAADNDTVAIDMSIVPSDTTPPILSAAQARDSTEVLLTFDDHLEPDSTVTNIEVALFTLPDTTRLPDAARLVRPDVYEEERRARADSARADSLRADTAAADTLAGRLPPPTPGGFGPELDPEVGPLPVRELVLIPARPLDPEASYLVRIGTVTNVSGVTGEAGQVEFQVPARPPPAPADTTSAPPDTTASLLDMNGSPLPNGWRSGGGRFERGSLLSRSRLRGTAPRQ